MKTRKLFYEDPYMHSFAAKVVAKKAGWVALDQTAFYPEGGGQPADHGWLQDAYVDDVQIDDSQIIWHQVAADLAVGQAVEGRLDWQRRFDHMQQHTAQHVLSQAFWQLCQAATVGFHLGEQIVTIDLEQVDLSETELNQVEALTNAVLRSKLPVACQQVTKEELAAMADLRKMPLVNDAIRLVGIGDYDVCPCGGTHVRDLGEIGLLKILGTERKRGNLRVSFVAGRRAYHDYEQKHAALVALSALFSEPIETVVQAAHRAQEKMDDLERENKRLREQLLTIEAESLCRQAEMRGSVGLVCAELADKSLADAKFMAGYLAAQGGMVSILGVPDDLYRLVITVSSDVDVAAGAVLRQILPTYEGKGGGSAATAQGAVALADGRPALHDLQQACRESLSLLL